MEEKKYGGDMAPKELPEGLSDMELALALAAHIDKPCEVEIESGKRETIRDFYLREAKRQLDRMSDGAAREFLKDKIQEFQLPKRRNP